MYSGQLENVQLPIGTFGCVISGIGVAALLRPLERALDPAARERVGQRERAGAPEEAAPCVAQPRSTTNVCSGLHASCTSRPTPSDSGSAPSVFCANTLSSSPPAAWMTYWIETPRNAATTILPAQHVGAVRDGLARREQRDLLRPHADAHRRRSCGPQRSGACSVGAVVGLDPRGRCRATLRVDQVRDAEEVGHERGLRALVEVGRASRPARSCRRSSPRSCRPCSWPLPGRGSRART